LWQTSGVENGRSEAHIHWMEYNIALGVVAPVIVFAAVYSLLTLRKRK